MMRNMNGIEVLFIAITGFLSSVLGILYVPVLLMISLNVLDYVTGIIASRYRPDLNYDSYKGSNGIIKKVTLWLLVIVGALMDILLRYACGVLGYNLYARFFIACVVAIWIICNEFISILENLTVSGVELPKFLLPLIKGLKEKINSIGDDDDGIMSIVRNGKIPEKSVKGDVDQGSSDDP